MRTRGSGLLALTLISVLSAGFGWGTAVQAATRHYVPHRYVRHHYVRHRYIRHHAQRVSHPYVRSREAFVYDATRARVLYAKRSTGITPIASISKLMTTLVVAEAHQPLNQRLQVTRADWTPYSHLPIGIWLTRAQLFHLALMSSENRAARTLCNDYPGGLHACVRAMNAKARALGMMHTHFVEPTGLSPSNVSTPADLAKLVMAAAHNPIIRRYSTSPGYTVHDGRWRLPYYPTDPLVRNRWWHIVVQKTGFTNPAGQCLVLDTYIDHHNIVMVLMHSWGKYTRTADAMRVKQWLQVHLLRHHWPTVAARM
jgi:D-alanyl-D-alanine endopeptidase (penicillin-binding protein 7)